MSFEILHREPLVPLPGTDVSEEHIASTFRITRLFIRPSSLRRHASSKTLKMRRYVPPKRRFLLEPHGVISQKIFIIVTSVKTFQQTAFFGPTVYSSRRTLIKTHSTKERPINNNSTVKDKLNCGSAMQEVFFEVRREAYPRCEKI
jgi:hypothetical protein